MLFYVIFLLLLSLRGEYNGNDYTMKILGGIFFYFGQQASNGDQGPSKDPKEEDNNNTKTKKKVLKKT